MSGLQSLIGQLGIFIICAQAILHFRPKKAYEKYLRLLLSLMILMQAIQPLYSFLHRDESVEWQVSLEYFQEKLDESMAEAVKQAAVSEGVLEQMSLEEVQERMEATEVEDNIIKIEPVQVELRDADLSEENADDGASGEVKRGEVEP